MAAISVSLVNASYGALVGFATISLTHLNLDKNEESWFASLDFFCAIIFTPLGGLISGWIGRKNIILTVSPFAAFGWILIALSESKFTLFAGRIISSIAVTSMMPIPSKFKIRGFPNYTRNNY